MASGKEVAKPDEVIEPEVSKRGGTQRLPAGQVRVWSEIRLTVPLPGPERFTGAFGITIGQERLAKSSSSTEIAKAHRLAEESNERELERQMRKFLKQIKRDRKAIEAGDDPDATLHYGSAQERAMKQLGGKKKKSKKKGKGK